MGSKKEKRRVRTQRYIFLSRSELRRVNFTPWSVSSPNRTDAGYCRSPLFNDGYRGNDLVIRIAMLPEGV